MDLDFLYAANETRLSKEFRDDETIPYPHVRDFSSIRTTANSIEEFHAALCEHAAQGACLLGGNLDQQLHDESRAGHTSPLTPTQWLPLDLDFHEGYDSIDQFLTDLDPNLSDVSYIVQRSASSYISNEKSLRCHVFLQLSSSVAPPTLKHWLRLKNITTPKLYDRTSLSATGLCLKFPLDISTAQNDKLIFIAPPLINGEPAATGDAHIQLVRKTTDYANLDFSDLNPANTQTLIDERIDELRAQQKLRKRKPRYKNDILLNPDRAHITGIHEARGFVYLSLNGGSSHPYYFPASNPTILYNFKGEPPVYLRDIAPDIYEAFAPKSQIITADDTFKPFVCHDVATDQYYTVEPRNDDIDLHIVNNLTKAQHFLMQRGLPVPDAIEDWAVDFDPTTLTRLDPTNRRINKFRPTSFLTATYTEQDLKPFPTIERVLRHLFGDTYNRAMNWLATIFQLRIKTQTAWALSGTSGTGKGLLFSQMLTPLFGADYCKPVLMSNLEEQYNAFLLESIILWIDEAHVEDRNNSSRVMNRLKNLITEINIPIRMMRANVATVRTHNNVIAASNHGDMFPLQSNDRRMNIAPPQMVKILVTPDDVKRIADELPHFAAFLALYEINVDQARSVVLNEHRERMIQASANTTDRFFEALRTADLSYFISFCDSTTDPADGDYAMHLRDYKQIIETWMDNAGRPTRIPRTELMAVYNFLQGTRTTPTKFTRMCNIHGVDITQIWLNGENVRGIEIEFPPLEQLTNIVPMRHNAPTRSPESNAAAN